MALKEIWIETGEDYSSSSKKYKYGYNKEIDAVCISRDGTAGRVVIIDGLRIALPKPPSKKKILNYYKKKENQIWEREPLPSELAFIKESKHYYEQIPSFKERWDPYISQEWDRRIDGVWIYINGEEIYLTGRNYMFLQWNSLGGNRYPKYRWAQMVLWVHWEACVADSRCIGQCYLKNRRSGYSTMNMADDLNFASSHEFVNVGIMSKTSKDASKMFTGMVIPAYKQYPFFFKPITDGSTNPKAELVFREPATRLGKNNRLMVADTGLNSVITHWTTALNSMDGMRIDKMSLDEIGKYPKDCAFDEYWQIAMECLTEGGDNIGKVMAGSTANSSKKGGAAFKNIYYDSKVETRDDVVYQTKSGMYSLFIPAEYNLSKFIDKFGKPILKDSKEGIENEKGEVQYIGAVSFLKARRDRFANDPEKLNEELRKNPSTEEHAFRDPSSDSNFNLAKIYDQLDHNANLKTSETVRGDFEWLEKDKSVVFVPNPDGSCLVRWMPKPEDRNKVEYINGEKHPANKSFIVGGIDSYDISKTVDGRGSNGAMHIYLKNGFDDEVYDEFVCEYVDRPATAEMFYENCIKIAFFYGAELLIENNKPRVLYHFRDRGYRKYSANRPDRSYKRLSRSERDLGGIPNSSNEVKLWHAESIANYINRHVGVNVVPEYGTIGEMGRCYFNELLQDWAEFDINDRTKYDRSISSGLCLMLANFKIKEKDNEAAPTKFVYFRTYKR